MLAAHVDAGAGRFRGIRHATSRDPDPAIRAQPRRLARRPHGHARVPRRPGACWGRWVSRFDAWLYHPQIARAGRPPPAPCPSVTIVLDHLGGPLGIGPYTDRAAVLEGWRASMADVATCPNVFLKVGGIGMPDFGIAWHKRERPPTSDDLADAWGDDIRYAIDTLGPSAVHVREQLPGRPQGLLVPGAVERVQEDGEPATTPAEQRWLFHDTAATAYRLT